MYADVVYPKLSKSVHACRTYSLPKLTHFLTHSVGSTQCGQPQQTCPCMPCTALNLDYIDLTFQGCTKSKVMCQNKAIYD